MTTYNTGNPLGSVDVRDLYDNAQNADNFNNGPLDAYPDRFGVSRQSLQGIRNASQYQVLGPYAAGLEFTSYNQVFTYLGEFYAPSAGLTLPYTTTGIGAAEIANFRSVGDAVIRQDLADQVSTINGSALIGYRGRTLRARLDEEVSIKNFGAVGDGISDDTSLIQAAINSGLPLFIPAGTYKLTATLTKTTSNLYMRGVGPASAFFKSGDYGDTLRITDPAGLAVLTDIVISDVAFVQDTSIQATSGSQLVLNAVRNFWLRGVHIRNGFRGFSNLGSDQGHIDGMYVLFDHDNGGLTTGRRYVEVLPTANTGKGAHPGDVFFTNCNFRGSSFSYCASGFYMTAGDGIWLNNSHVGSCTQHTLHVNADNATKCTGLLVGNCWIDFGAGATGVRLQGSTPAINGNHYFRNCKMLGADFNTNGVDIDGSARNIRITDCEISDFLNTGINIRSTYTGTISIIDNVIRDCSRSGSGLANGITYAPDVRAVIVGNTISGPLHSQHINIQGTKTRATINNNDLIPPTVSAVMSPLSGAAIRQQNNNGYNPTGTQPVTVGASPWTYTNAFGYPVEVFLGGGTVSLIQKNSLTLTGFTGGAFTLGPNETLSVTYSVAPSVLVFGL